MATQSGGGVNYSADNVDYDNTTSGLTADNVQDAIDEIETNIGDINTSISDIQGDITDINNALPVNVAMAGNSVYDVSITWSSCAMINNMLVGAVEFSVGITVPAYKTIIYAGTNVPTTGTHITWFKPLEEYVLRYNPRYRVFESADTIPAGTTLHASFVVTLT